MSDRQRRKLAAECGQRTDMSCFYTATCFVQYQLFTLRYPVMVKQPKSREKKQQTAAMYMRWWCKGDNCTWSRCQKEDTKPFTTWLCVCLGFRCFLKLLWQLRSLSGWRNGSSPADTCVIRLMSIQIMNSEWWDSNETDLSGVFARKSKHTAIVLICCTTITIRL